MIDEPGWAGGQPVRGCRVRRAGSGPGRCRLSTPGSGGPSRVGGVPTLAGAGDVVTPPVPTGAQAAEEPTVSMVASTSTSLSMAAGYRMKVTGLRAVDGLLVVVLDEALRRQPVE